MPGNNRKLAAVPFINPKGERSMKRVKVERHVAGRKPSYARDQEEEEEEEEYYTTDEEEEEHDYEVGQQNEDVKDDYKRRPDVCNKLAAGHERVQEESEQCPSPSPQPPPRLHQEMLFHMKPRDQPPNVIIDDDDDEEDIRRRHARARMRKLELPTGRPEQNFHSDDDNDDSQDTKPPTKRLDTDDLLKDIQLTGFSRPSREEPKMQRPKINYDDEEAEEQARIEEVNRKVEQDIKREAERLALAKSHIVARELASVNTDDEDEELAQEEWKLREIQRVMRYRAERQLRT